MNEKYKRDFVLRYMEKMLFIPYVWGGDDPILGFDCSGALIEPLKAVGILSYKGDWTADGLMDMFPAVEFPQAGDLVGWRAHDRFVHIELVCDTMLELSIGASGGGSKTLTEQDAASHNGYIKVRPYRNRRKEEMVFANPYIRGPQ